MNMRMNTITITIHDHHHLQLGTLQLATLKLHQAPNVSRGYLLFVKNRFVKLNICISLFNSFVFVTCKLRTGNSTTSNLEIAPVQATYVSKEDLLSVNYPICQIKYLYFSALHFCICNMQLENLWGSTVPQTQFSCNSILSGPYLFISRFLQLSQKN